MFKWNSYDEFINFATTNDNINIIHQKLKLKPVQTRLFISAYSFRYFTTDVIQLPFIPQDPDIVQSAIDLTSYAENIWETVTPEQLNELQRIIKLYTDKFKVWKDADKTRVCMPFITKFNQLRQLKNIVDENKSFYSKDLKYLADMSMLQVIGMIHQLGGEAACAYVDQQPTVQMDEDFKNEMIQSSITSFWGTFKEQLPNYEYLIPLLRDFAHRYEKCIPNRVDLHEQLAQVINLDTILEGIEKNSITTEQIKMYLNYILDKTKELASIEDRDRLFNVFYPILNVNSYEDNTLLLRDYFTNLLSYYDELINKLNYLRASFSNTNRDD